MFICEKCRVEKGWPESPNQSESSGETSTRRCVVCKRPEVLPDLRLVPPPSADATEKNRATCRRILLEMLNRVEAGEVDELVVATINSKTSPTPHYLRWHFSDPVRTVGLMYFAATHFASSSFITMEKPK